KRTSDENPLAALGLKGADLDQTLRAANRWYDRYVGVIRQKNPTVRADAWRDYKADLDKLGVRAKDMSDWDKAGSNPETRGKAVGEKLGEVLIYYLQPAAHKIRDHVDQAGQLHTNVVIAFALARYR